MADNFYKLAQNFKDRGSVSSPKSPWDETKSDNDAFFPSQDLQSDRWNKLYPYRLLVVDASTGGVIQNGSPGYTSKTSNTSGFDFHVIQEESESEWIFTLPITPQNITVQDTYSINTTATMRGVVEEHNGVKFKMISISGTTGELTNKYEKDSLSPSPLGGFFGGTIEAFNGLSNKVSSLLNAVGGKHPATPPKEREIDSKDSGYYQALRLSQFLERYAMEKKNPANSNYRLVFDIAKENQAFICTPMSFSLTKNQNKPMEYQFQLVLKAWKRIDLSSSASPTNDKVEGLSLDTLQKINSVLRETRATLSSSLNLIKSVRSDFNAPLEALRQTALCVKDLSGVVTTVADLPATLIKDLKDSYHDSVSIFESSFNLKGNNFSSSKADSQESRTAYAIRAIREEFNSNEGLPQSQVENGSLGKEKQDSSKISKVNDIFNDSLRYFDFFDRVSYNQLPLSTQQKEQIEQEIEKIRLINIQDLRIFKAQLQSLSDDISNSFGAGDEIYSKIYNKPPPKTRITPMTIEENEILSSIYESIQAYDLLIKNKQFDDSKIQSPLAFVGGYANDVGIPFTNYSSKYLAPVPFGLTIEEIATRYLGSPDKFLEIATLNNLRSPYIDETGFSSFFLSNGEDRRLTVSDPNSNFYLGQKIIIQSTIIPPFSRKIINLERFGVDSVIITIDGEANLSDLKLSDAAVIKGYLPGTVNSQNQIYIPSNKPSQSDDRIFSISHLNEEKMSDISKVDFLLSENGDLAINSVGDIRLANGLTNLIQALKIKMQTKKGALIRHLDFGLNLNVGSSIADIETGNIAKEINKIVTDDPRFSGVDRLDISLKGGTIEISMSVKIANGTGYVPISFKIS